MPHDDQLVAAVLQVVRELHAIHEQLATANNNNAILHRLAEMEKHIMAGQAEISAALKKIDDATNKIAANVDAIATIDQKISDEIDAFIAANPVGTVITDEQVAQLQSLADRGQAASDASDAQVAVLKAIAAKGEQNPVPVPVPPTPTP